MRQQHIRRLDVAVNLALAVQVVQPLQQLLADDGDVRFVENARF
jgi:hypothetical protein